MARTSLKNKRRLTDRHRSRTSFYRDAAGCIFTTSVHCSRRNDDSPGLQRFQIAGLIYTYNVLIAACPVYALIIRRHRCGIRLQLPDVSFRHHDSTAAQGQLGHRLQHHHLAFELLPSDLHSDDCRPLFLRSHLSFRINGRYRTLRTCKTYFFLRAPHLQ